MSEPIFEPVVQKLVTWLDEPEKNRRKKLEESVSNALNQNVPELHKLGIDDLSSFLKYINDLLHWVPTENEAGKDVYFKLVCFYFIFNQAPFGEEQTQIAPQNVGNMSWFSRWLVEYAVAIGKWMDNPNSLTRNSLKTFRSAENYNLWDYIEPRGGWKTFNEFFARNFKPGHRPITSISDATVITSPADSTFDGWWNINENSKVCIKGFEWDINDLLADSVYGDKFAGGLFMHSFLNTFDYHRQHAPVPGTVVEVKNIQGQVYLETAAVEDRITGKKTICPVRNVGAPDNAGYQFVQSRGLIVMESNIGYVAILPMGMAQVSSVVITAEQDVQLHKGEEISYFQFGGSDIVMVFQAGANVNITATKGKHYKVGVALGTGSLYESQGEE